MSKEALPFIYSLLYPYHLAKIQVQLLIYVSYCILMYFEGQVWTKVASKERYAGGVWWQNQVSTDFVKFRTKSWPHCPFFKCLIGWRREIILILLLGNFRHLSSKLWDPYWLYLSHFLTAPLYWRSAEFELLCENWLRKKLYHKSIRLIQVLFIHIARMLWDSSRRRCPWQCFDEFKTWIKLTVQYAEKEFVLVHHRNPNHPNIWI